MRVIRVLLYARVSGKSQVKGFSLDQQIEALREYAEAMGYEIVAEYRDPGYSGTTLDRPELDRLRDRVEGGGIDMVIAQDADRITRNPGHRMILDEECAKHGSRLYALDDWGDDSHEGQLLKFIKGWQAKGEVKKTAERVKRNKRKKARSGMIVGGHNKSYGFDFSRDDEGRIVAYVLNEDENHVVRRIFRDVASGKGIRTVKDALDAEKVPTPWAKPGKAWNRQFIRDMLVSDIYRPHTTQELRKAGVSDEVLVRLTRDGDLYGLYRFGEERIPVPVPDAGVPLEVVEAARYRLENYKEPSKNDNDNRSWELSGGIMRCSECDRAMQSHTVKKSPSEAGKSSKTYHYYRCQSMTSGKADPCSNKKQPNASKIEAEVWSMVRRVMDDTPYLLDQMAEHFERERRKLKRPASLAGMNALLKDLERIEKTWTKNKLAYEADAISVADLAARRAELDEERETKEAELERVKNRDAELARLDQQAAALRERILAGYQHVDDSPEGRRKVYLDMRLLVKVGSDGVPHITGFFPVEIGDRRYTAKQIADEHRIFMPAPLPEGSGAGVGSGSDSSWPRCTPTTLPGL